jgi:colanic acid/amylovoran biosynthesis glycosyltransferase
MESSLRASTAGAVRAPDRPPRVLHAATRYGVVSETFVYDAVLEADRLGWEAWLATESLENRAWFPFPPDERIIRARELGPWERAAARISPRRSAEGFSRRFRASAATLEPALIHAHFGWAGRDALPLAKALGIPLIVTFHASDVLVASQFRRRERPGAIARRERHRYSKLFSSVPRVIAVSEFMAARVRGLGFDGRIDIVPAGVRLEQFDYRDPTSEGPLRIAFVGRQVPRKGLDVLIEALALVLREHPDVTLRAIGDGPSAAENAALAQRLEIAGNVEFLGARPADDVRRLLSDSDMFVMCSRTMPNGEAEGSPVATKEALAVGLAVVATDNGGTGETLPPEQRSELVPEEDPGALARRICALLDARETWPQRARAGREFVEREFDWSTLAARTTQIYAELCG